MNVATTPVYPIQYIQTLTWNGFDCTLPDEVVDLVSQIADQVGAPSYVKTPIFPKREKESNTVPIQRKKNNSTEITNTDWELIRSFQATELQIRNGIDAELDQIRSDLNKISEKTFNDVLTSLCARIDKLEACHLSVVGEYIFNTASSNHFFSSLYAKLFNHLFKRYNTVFDTIFQTSFNQYILLFDKIERGDPKKEYTKFCEINKNNDKRRAMSMFLTNLMKEGIVEPFKIIDIVQKLQTMINEHLRKVDYSNEVEELTENLFIIIKDAHSELNQSDEWNSILLEIEFISKLKPKNVKYPSITNKTIFKHMDMLDEINK